MSNETFNQKLQALLAEYGISRHDAMVQSISSELKTCNRKLTKREYMATHFMAAIIQSTVLDDLPEETQAAKDAVEYADALLKELAKTK